MKKLAQYLRELYSGPFQAALVFSFTLVAALTTGSGAWVISRTITDYLSGAMEDRVAQDLLTARVFYRFQEEDLRRSASQLALSNTVIQQIPAAARSDSRAVSKIEKKIQTAFQDSFLQGNRVAAVLDEKGELLAGWVITSDGKEFSLWPGEAWTGLPILDPVYDERAALSGTDVIPAEILQKANLDDQARVEILDTPRAAANLFDPREKEDGLGIIAAAPILRDGHPAGAVVVFHLFNHDFSLVDVIKENAEIDTVTIFFGDLRVSTNVMTAEGNRAVGTRVSEEVSRQVLKQGIPYNGTAFVVDQNYITRYEPLTDFNGEIVGMLYVGARQTIFENFLNTFRERVVLVAAVTILTTFLLATPVSRVITRPLKDLQTLASTSRKVADGNLDARAPTSAGGEVGILAESFNEMLDRLQEAQERLIQSEKLASLGQLSAGVAHELNNPLTTITLFAEVLDKEGALDPEQQLDVEVILREAERCQKIVSSLLDFSRKQQVETQEVDLNHLVRQAVSLEVEHPRYCDVEVVLDLTSDLPWIQADEDQLRTVVVNLMNNAADAMPEGGKLILHTAAADADHVSLKVSDQGVGIAPENQSKLFTPFFTTKPPGKGTGLGLSIVYGIVKIHRGEITIDSQINQGTTVTVSLPIRLQDGFISGGIGKMDDMQDHNQWIDSNREEIP